MVFFQLGKPEQERVKCPRKSTSPSVGVMTPKILCQENDENTPQQQRAKRKVRFGSVLSSSNKETVVVVCVENPTQAIIPFSVSTPSQVDLDKHRKILWYSKQELRQNKKDVRRTIRYLRAHGGPTLFTRSGPLVTMTSVRNDTSTESKHNDESAEQWELHPSLTTNQDIADTRQVDIGSVDPTDELDQSDDDNVVDEEESICYRGCERYYSLETRFMTQRMHIDAILDAQKDTLTIQTQKSPVIHTKELREGTPSFDSVSVNSSEDYESNSLFLREISETLSEACKDLAQWHGSLNAIHVYGLRGTTMPSSQPF